MYAVIMALCMVAASLVGASAQMLETIVNAASGGGGGGGGTCGGTGTIARDANSCANGTCGGGWSNGSTITWSHTTSGSNRALIVVIGIYDGQTTTGVTYNSVAMTKATSVTGNVESNTQDTSMWYLAAPATGSHSITATLSGSSSFTGGVAESYTGVNQSAPVFSSNSGHNNSAANSFSLGTTATGGNACWLVGGTFTRGGGASAGTGTSLINNDADQIANFDSNGTVTAGNPTLNWTGSSITWPGVITAAIAPTP